MCVSDPVPARTGDRVASRPHLVVDLHGGQLPADALVRAAHGEPGLGQRPLVHRHAGGRLCSEGREEREIIFSPSSHLDTGGLLSY